jgi:hypothetical protein
MSGSCSAKFKASISAIILVSFKLFIRFPYNRHVYFQSGAFHRRGTCLFLISNYYIVMLQITGVLLVIYASTGDEAGETGKCFFYAHTKKLNT